MYRVVINKCYGGFSVSKEAMLRLLELGYQDCDYKSKEDLECPGFTISEYHPYIHRHDKRLLQVIDELGIEKVSGRYSKLHIEEIECPLYRIKCYDGYESIETPDSDMEWIDCRD